MAAGFELAKAWVDIGARTVSWDRALGNVKKQMKGLGESLGAFSGHVYTFWGALAGAGGGAAFALKSYAEQERADQQLKSALASTGNEVDKNYEKLKNFATQLQKSTVYGDDATEALIAYALNLGVTADNMEDVVKVGIGLGEAFFGGDSKAGIEAAAKAQQGNFKALEKLSKSVKDAKGPQEKLNEVVKLGNAGFTQAQDRTGTFEGMMLQLKNQIGEVGEAFGELLLPQMKQFATWGKNIAEMLQNLTTEQKQTIIHFAAIGAALAGVMIFGPPLLSFVGDFITLGTSLTKVLFSIGRLMIASFFTPIGLIVGGLAIAATAFAYFTGTGTTALGKLANGFGQLWTIIDTFFGSFQGMSELWDLVIETTANNMIRIWSYVKYYVKTIWSQLAQAVVDSLDIAWTSIKSWGTNVVNFFGRLGMQIGHAWTTMTNYLGDKLAKLMLMAPKSVGGMGMTGAQADKAISSARKDTDAAAENEYNKKIAGFNSEWQTSLDKMDQAWAERITSRAAGAKTDRAGYQKDLEDDLKTIADMESKSTADRTQRMSKLQAQTLSNRLKELVAAMMKGTGIDDAMKKFNDLKAELDKVKGGAMEGAGGLGVREKADAEKGTFTSLEESFKKNLEGQFSGAHSLKNMSREHTTAMMDHVNAMGRFNNSVAIFGNTVKFFDSTARFGR